MADSKSLPVEKQELTRMGDSERTRECRCFVPRADIYEVEDQIVIAADVPGADIDSIDVTLEKNKLTIDAYVNSVAPEGYSLSFAEYEIGDYQRSFRLSDEIDQENIQASVKDGVLRLYLPKSSAARTRKINVKSG